MKNVMTAGAALLLTTSIASAGGLDRSGQGIGAIFEDGRYVELSFGSINPSVSGTLPVAPGVTLDSGNVGVDYIQLGAAYKADLTDQISYAIILDQPYGANVAYTSTDPGYPLSSTEAEFRSTGVSVIGRYKFDENFSIHGGVRAVTIDADLRVAAATGDVMTSFVYEAGYDKDTQFAGVIGAAYERPEIALRIALTYTGSMDFSHDTDFSLASAAPTVEGSDQTEYTIPQSINLDFQTGVAADTLVFGSIRWVEWTETEVNSPGYPPNPVISYDDDVFTYNLGVGRRFSDEFAGSVAVGYEKANGGAAQNLAPTDGNFSLSVGGAYTLENGVELSGGIRFINIGDAETRLGVPADADPNTSFDDNTAVAIGLKVAYNF